MILLIDNYDSFTYNLYQYISELGARVEVRRNDRISLEEIETLGPERIVISPGPKTPTEAGVSLDAILRFGATIPTLGICLGHQCIGQAFGARVVRAPELMHGKTSAVTHSGAGILKGMPNPFQAGRYHSLVVDRASIPAELAITAESPDGLVMGLRHRRYPIHGVQFHPESVLTPQGKQLLRNFLEMEN